jgi:2-dehydropantoate 2-reductase
MRIGVIGAGAIGGTIASLLHRAGHEIEVTARGAGLAAIRSDGLVLSGAWGEHVAGVSASPTLTATPELAFVCTKAQDATAAIRANATRLAGIPVVIVQNGLHGRDAAAQALPASECIGALALYAANYRQPGQVTVTATGNTYLGVGTAQPTATVRRVADILNGAMPSIATANFVGCQWTKLIINEVNAMPAITGLSVQDTIADRRLRTIITSAMREAVDVGIASDMRFGPLQGLNDRLLRIFARLPLWAAQLLPRLMSRRMGHTPNLGSTLQSLERGQVTEIDHLSGAIVAAGRAIGRRTPLNTTLVRLVHEVERTKQFLAPDRVAAEVTD